jgi:hypothetical protein
LKHKFLMLTVAALLVLGGALPALASHQHEEPPCEWDGPLRYVERNYGQDAWLWVCQDAEGVWFVEGFWLDGRWYGSGRA